MSAVWVVPSMKWLAGRPLVNTCGFDTQESNISLFVQTVGDGNSH